MTRLTKITASALAVAALAPATALADAELRGAPTLRQASANTATLTFAVDDKLPRKANGSIDARVRFKGGVSSIASWGRHGNDHKYRATVRADGLTAGRKYRVTILVAGEDPIVRQVKLHPAK